MTKKKKKKTKMAQKTRCLFFVGRVVPAEEPGDVGATVTLQWVPGHADIDGNEAADLLANEASTGDETTVPIDLTSAREAIWRHAAALGRARTAAAQPCPAPYPPA